MGLLSFQNRRRVSPKYREREKKVYIFISVFLQVVQKMRFGFEYVRTTSSWYGYARKSCSYRADVSFLFDIEHARGRKKKKKKPIIRWKRTRRIRRNSRKLLLHTTPNMRRDLIMH